MKAQFLIVLVIISIHLSCNKDDEERFELSLPLITQTGENTFGCYIDGVLVIPRDGANSVFGPARGMQFIASGSPPDYEYNIVDVQDYKSPSAGILDIHLVNLHNGGEGIYQIKEGNCQRGTFANPTINIRARIFDQKDQMYKWYCSIEDSGSLTISRYDFENRIVSGTFSCQAVNQDDPFDIVAITEGRFDIDWERLNTTYVDEFP